MKKFIFPLLVLTGLFSNRLYSQKQGVITYEIKMHLRMKDDSASNYKAPEYITGTGLLIFNENESLYTPVPDDDAEGFDNGVKIFRPSLPQNIFYSSFRELQQIEQTEFMGKKFRVSDTLKVNSWKPGTATRRILGHDCKEASIEGDSLHPSLSVWYTGDLGAFLGPENMNTLPGAVLEVIIDGGRGIITVRNIEIRELRKNELKVPKGGRLINRPEYEKMVREQFEEMKKNANGNVLIGG